MNFEINPIFLSSRFSTWPKSQDKILNILRTKKTFKVKWKAKAFFIIDCNVRNGTKGYYFACFSRLFLWDYLLVTIILVASTYALSSHSIIVFPQSGRFMVINQMWILEQHRKANTSFCRRNYTKWIKI